MKYLILFLVIVVALVSYANIDVIWAWVSSWKAETVMIATAIASIVIAACALVATTVQGLQNRKHNRLSVEPFLTHTESNNLEDGIMHYAFLLNNRGVGPAIIKSFILLYEGNEVSRDNSHDYVEFLEEKMKGFESLPTYHFGPRSILEAGQGQTLWGLEYDPLKQDISFLKKIDIVMEYQSIYQDKIFYHVTEDARKTVSAEPLIKQKFQQFATVHALCFTIPRPWTADEFANIMANSNAFHILHDFGFAMGQRLDDTETELLTLAIIPEEQGKGHGRDLLNQFIAEVKYNGGQNILLEVAKNNTTALHMYKAAGFYEIGNRPAYYTAPNTPAIDAILMRMDINST